VSEALERLVEKAGNPYRLGRHIELDPRSLGYRLQQSPSIKPAEHLSPIPILDQGNLGSCVGNAATRHLAAIYGPDMSGILLHGRTLTLDPDTDERFAVELYHAATVKDGFPGVYPPNDTGSSGLGAMRALKEAHLISAYHWATSLRGFASMLQRGSCIIGMPWYEAFFNPDTHGFIDADTHWAGSGLAGGHEVYVAALEAWDDRDSRKVVFRLDNSWGTSWGAHGSFRMHGSTYIMLRHQIDLKQATR